MDMGELWEKACMLLKGEMNEISYNTWIQSSLKPLALEGDCMVLCTSAEYMKSMISSRYATLITNALSEVAGRPMQVEILTRAEADKRQSKAEPEAPAGFASMSLNPKYTFDTFVWATATASPMPRRWQWLNRLPRPITRCLSMAAWVWVKRT